MPEFKRYFLPLALGVTHGVADCISGVIVGFVAIGAPLATASVYILLYNVLAFGTQPIAGLLCDRGIPRITAVLGSVLLFILAVLTYKHYPLAAVIAAGVASSIFHAAAGGTVFASDAGHASFTGIFAAPGVAGLALAGWLVASGTYPVAPLVVLLLLCGTAIAAVNHSFTTSAVIPVEDEPVTGHLLVMCLLLAAIALRSVVWNIAGYLNAGNTGALLLLGICAAAGKVAGGFGAEWLGVRRWLFWVLPAAAVVLALSGKSLVLTAAGVFLLQSVTPAAAVLVALRLKAAPSLASGLVFGLAIAAGGIPFFAGFSAVLALWQFTVPVLLLLVIAATWLGARPPRAAPA